MSAARLELQVRRKRGARPGNTHDLMHGLYSRHISVREDELADEMEQNSSRSELLVARIQLDACLMLLKEAKTLAEWLSIDAAIQGWVEKIAMITHRNALLGKDKRMALVTIMDYIRTANERQKVAR